MLIYSAIVSLDGLVADEHGRIEWAEPDEEVHAVVNELERAAGTHLYGRGMYETMAVWETVPAGPEPGALDLRTEAAQHTRRLQPASCVRRARSV